jgi:hypothetical protein
MSRDFLDLCRHVRPDVHLHSSSAGLLCLLQEFERRGFRRKNVRALVTFLPSESKASGEEDFFEDRAVY